MPCFRFVFIALAAGLGLSAHTPLFASSGSDNFAAPQAAAAVTLAAPKQPEIFTPMLAINWSLTPGNSDQAAPPATGSDRAEGLGEDAQIGPPDDAAQANEIIVDGSYGPPENDPAEAINLESYRITQAVDNAFVEPIAYAYRDGLPTPIRDGLGNVVRNLGEPVNALNFLLQGKIGKAFETLTRLAINSTLGLGGVIDIAAKPGIGLPYRRNGFANTLGYYGVKPGAYLYLPFTGATSVRDVIGSGLDQLLLPVAVGAPFNTLEYAVPYFVVNSLDARLAVDEELARIDAAVDPYAARRDTYLARREREIALLKGEEPPEPPLILLEVEGVIEPGEEAPPLGYYLERGVMKAGQIR